MRHFAIFFLVGVFMLVVSAPGHAVTNGKNAQAMPDRLTDFYNRHIDMKIAAAEEHVSMAESGYPEGQCLARRGREEVRFYKEHREDLIQQMAREGIGMKPYKAHYFLTEAFLRAHPAADFTC